MVHPENVANDNYNTKIGIVGLGFVGLPLALLFAEKGFKVTGIDVDNNKIEQLNNGISYLPDIPDSYLQRAVFLGNLVGTTDYDMIKALDVVIVCVPTPLTTYKNPDLSYLQLVGKELAPRIKNGQLIILESSTYPGTTEEVFQPMLENSGLKVGKDFFIGYSPERIDPGNKKYKVDEIPKIVSGITDQCLSKISTLYKKVFKKIVPVSSSRVAEFTKLLENSYRFINISFINEMAMLCDEMEINLWEAVAAANTKPYGFTPFYPGPGAGGHCIPVDPLYLVWKSNHYGIDSKMIRLSDEINDQISNYIVKNITNFLSEKEEKKVLVYGVTYKKDIDDVRESPAIKIISQLHLNGIGVSYHDPYVSKIKVGNKSYSSVNLTKTVLSETNCVLILTDHSEIPLENILEHAELVYDVRNVTNGLSGKAKIIRLGGGGQ
ncbi:nucleotide sugar dehydrogenase [Neobacillus mesonae]|uniref:nucleotide sugar dehydrogenase n=1 Tax=Neobacillus mesonae TaxID=1193713 RepID=UPI002E1A7E26|nr:nucleotide sugar dehydrogenase [Neobacillus mesonae]